MKRKARTIRVDGDSLVVALRYDAQWNVWLGEYPFFKDEPRHTPTVRPWRNVAYTHCTVRSTAMYTDCGSCPHYQREDPSDLIGVCFHEANRHPPSQARLE